MINFVPLSNRSTQQRAQATQQEAKKEDPKTIIEEEMYKELIKGGVGLRSDINKWVDQVMALESSSEYPYLENQNINNIGAKIKIWHEIREHYRNYKDAFDLAKNQGGLNEVAVGNGGELFVKDKGAKLKSISMSEYSKNRDKYNPLTVYELLQEREINPNLAFNNSIYSVIDTAFGTEKIIDHIAQLVDKVGSFSHTLTSTKGDPQLMNKAKEIASEFTGRKPTGEELEALGKLEQIMKSPSDYNEVKEHTKSSSKYISSALGYIWNSLGREKQLKLSAVAVMSGLENPKELIFDMLRSNKDETYELDIKPVDVDKATGVSASSGPMSDLSLLEIQTSAKSGTSTIPWNDPVTGLKMNLVGDRIELIKDVKSNDMIPMGPLENLLNSHTGALLEKNNVYFGDKKIALNDIKNIIIDPTSGSARVYMPVDTSGNPDYDILKKVEEIKKSLPKDLTPEELNKELKARGLNWIQVDNNFNFIPSGIKFKPFLLAYGYVDERSSIWEGNKEVKELDGTEEDSVEDIISGMYKNLKAGSPTGMFNWFNTYYKGNILIPYQENASTIASSLSNNIFDQKSTIDEVQSARKLSAARNINATSEIFK